MKRSRLIFFCFMICSFARAQEKISLPQALEIALKNNLSIRVAGNELEIAKNNTSLGNAGMMPSVDLAGSAGFSSNNSRQELASGTIIDKTGASAQNFSGGLDVSWTLFDGMKMFATHDKNNALFGMSETGVKLKIEEVVLNVIRAYCSLVTQQRMLNNIDSALLLHDERIRIVEEKWTSGRGPKTDLLQAKIDRNALYSLRNKQIASLAESKASFNEWLGRPIETAAIASDDVELNKDITLDGINKGAFERNQWIAFRNQQIKVSEFELRETKSKYFPTLNFNAGYGYSKTDNQAGFVLHNNVLGWSTGFSATWNIFDGRNTNRQIANAKISLLTAQASLEMEKLEVQKDLYAAYSSYQSALASLKLEEENALLSKENVELALERFKSGHASSLELKEAQKSAEDAITRKVQAFYDAKLSETKLMQLNGSLVKQ